MGDAATFLYQSDTSGLWTGSNYPNIYINVYKFGWPPPWLTWTHEWTKINSITYTGPEQFNIANFAIHAVETALPETVLKRN